MNSKIIASTHIGHVASKEELDKLGGLTAGVCYLPDTTATLFAEPIEKTQRRTGMIKASGHHSPFDHASFTIDFENLPKIVAMILNNEKMYTTSEKSARYKRMPLPEQEQGYYDKWLEIFKQLIIDRYQQVCPTRFTDTKIVKLAQENARYLTSVFTPTAMEYTISYRQLNSLYGMLKKEISQLTEKGDAFSMRLSGELQDLCENFENLGYIDDQLSDNRKNRSLSLIKKVDLPVKQYFGDVYCTTYKGSFAQLAQAQRHRTISYQMSIPKQAEFFVPPILKNDENLVKNWLSDCEVLRENTPQGMLVEIDEMGTLDNFMLKLLERNCSDAQLEIDMQSTATKKEMYKQMKEQNHPRAEELEPLMKGSRCTFPGYKCATPCGFKDGITGERLI